MNCYFCKQKAEMYSNGVHYKCISCAEKYNLDKILTSYDVLGMVYAHVFVKLNQKYDVRFHLRENKTQIDDQYYRLVKELYGFPFTLENIEQKLKTYLTFL